MENQKQAILAAAKMRFSHFGFAKTTVSEICRDCHISKRTLYQHFRSKNKLITALLASELEYLRSIPQAQEQSGAAPLHRLSQLMQSIGDYLRENYHFINRIKDALPSVTDTPYSSLLEKELTAQIARILSIGQHQNRIRNLDETVAAYIGFNLLQALSSPHFFPGNTEMHTGIDIFINGLARKK